MMRNSHALQLVPGWNRSKCRQARSIASCTRSSATETSRARRTAARSNARRWTSASSSNCCCRESAPSRIGMPRFLSSYLFFLSLPENLQLSFSALQVCQLPEHFLTMSFGLYLAISLPYNAVGIDDERISRCILLALKFGDAPILGSDPGRFIRQELEIESFFRAELLVGIAGIKAHAQNDCVLRLILCFIALEVVRLNRASLSKILGIEVQNDPFAAILIERDRASVLRWQREIGSSIAFCHSFCGLSRIRIKQEGPRRDCIERASRAKKTEKNSKKRLHGRRSS